MLMKREATSIGKSGTAYARTTLPAACGWGLPCLRCCGFPDESTMQSPLRALSTV